MFRSKFVAICNDFQNITGSAVPGGIQLMSLLDALRMRDTNGTSGITLTARVPNAIFMSQRMTTDEMTSRIDTTCETTLSTDAGALTQAQLPICCRTAAPPATPSIVLLGGDSRAWGRTEHHYHQHFSFGHFLFWALFVIGPQLA